MTAVVGPVGIEHSDLGHGRITLDGLEELLCKLDISIGHRQAPGLTEFGKLFFRLRCKTIDRRNGGRYIKYIFQSFRLIHRSFTALYRVDQVFRDRFLLVICNGSVEHDHAGNTYQRFFLLCQDLAALGSGVCTLVILARQGFDRQHISRTGCIDRLIIDIIDRRLRENDVFSEFILFIRQTGYIVSVEDPHALDRFYTDIGLDVLHQTGRLDSEFLLLLRKDSSNLITHK